jgi:hypothetical protein
MKVKLMKKLMMQVALNVGEQLLYETFRPCLKDAKRTILIHGADFFKVLRDASENMRLVCLEHGRQLKESTSK